MLNLLKTNILYEIIYWSLLKGTNSNTLKYVILYVDYTFK